MTDQQDVLGMPVREFIAAASAKTPTPGGGSVAGVVGALGVALGEMALNFSKGKKKLAEHAEYHEHLGGRLARARRMFQDLVADDIAAYSLYQEAMRQDDGPEKDSAVQLATAAAINVPREAAKLALALLEDMQQLAGKSNPWLITDLLAACALAAATVRLCDYNVRINVPQLADDDEAAQVKQASANDLAKADRLLQAVEEATKPLLP